RRASTLSEGKRDSASTIAAHRRKTAATSSATASAWRLGTPPNSVDSVIPGHLEPGGQLIDQNDVDVGRLWQLGRKVALDPMREATLAQLHPFLRRQVCRLTRGLSSSLGARRGV